MKSDKCDWSGCTFDRHGGWRFCETHLKLARQEMREEGYLQPVSWNSSSRTPEQMEDTRMTKYGYDG